MTRLLPIERRNARWWHMLNSASRSAILRGINRSFADNVIVNEYPKSGGSWLSQMLADLLELPFPRNRLPVLGTCLMQCHAINPTGMRDVVVVWRDRRDVVVSFYFYLIVGNEFGDPAYFEKNAAKLGIVDREDIYSNLPRFIDGLMNGEVGPRFSWPEFVRCWHGRDGVIETRYEDLLSNPVDELDRIVRSLKGCSLERDRIGQTVRKYSFTAQSGRKPGTEKQGAFLRKGVAGDWVNHFSPEALNRFNHYAGSALENLNYEK